MKLLAVLAVLGKQNAGERRRATRRKTPGHEAACSACSAWKAECRRKDGEQHAEKRPAKKLLAVLAVLGKQNAGE